MKYANRKRKIIKVTGIEDEPTWVRQFSGRHFAKVADKISGIDTRDNSGANIEAMATIVAYSACSVEGELLFDSPDTAFDEGLDYLQIVTNSVLIVNGLATQAEIDADDDEIDDDDLDDEGQTDPKD